MRPAAPACLALALAVLTGGAAGAGDRIAYARVAVDAAAGAAADAAAPGRSHLVLRFTALTVDGGCAPQAGPGCDSALTLAAELRPGGGYAVAICAADRAARGCPADSPAAAPPAAPAAAAGAAERMLLAFVATQGAEIAAFALADPAFAGSALPSRRYWEPWRVETALRQSFATLFVEQYEIDGRRAPPTMVRDLIQPGLAALGLYRGRIDAVAGPATLAAVRAFQAARGRLATGHLDAVERALLADAAGLARPVAAGPLPAAPAGGEGLAVAVAAAEAAQRDRIGALETEVARLSAALAEAQAAAAAAEAPLRAAIEAVEARLAAARGEAAAEAHARAAAEAQTAEAEAMIEVQATAVAAAEAAAAAAAARLAEATVRAEALAAELARRADLAAELAAATAAAGQAQAASAALETALAAARAAAAEAEAGLGARLAAAEAARRQAEDAAAGLRGEIAAATAALARAEADAERRSRRLAEAQMLLAGFLEDCRASPACAAELLLGSD